MAVTASQSLLVKLRGKYLVGFHRILDDLENGGKTLESCFSVTQNKYSHVKLYKDSTSIETTASLRRILESVSNVTTDKFAAGVIEMCIEKHARRYDRTSSDEIDWAKACLLFYIFKDIHIHSGCSRFLRLTQAGSGDNPSLKRTAEQDNLPKKKIKICGSDNSIIRQSQFESTGLRRLQGALLRANECLHEQCSTAQALVEEKIKLDADVGQARALLEQCQSKVAAMERSASDDAETIQRQRLKICNLEARMKEKEEEIDEGWNQLCANLRSELQDLQRDREVGKKNLREMSKQLENLQEKSEIDKAELTRLRKEEERIVRLTADKQNLIMENEKIISEKDYLRDTVTHSEEKIKTLELEMKNIETETIASNSKYTSDCIEDLRTQLRETELDLAGSRAATLLAVQMGGAVLRQKSRCPFDVYGFGPEGEEGS